MVKQPKNLHASRQGKAEPKKRYHAQQALITALERQHRNLCDQQRLGGAATIDDILDVLEKILFLVRLLKPEAMKP